MEIITKWAIRSCLKIHLVSTNLNRYILLTHLPKITQKMNVILALEVGHGINQCDWLNPCDVIHDYHYLSIVYL